MESGVPGGATEGTSSPTERIEALEAEVDRLKRDLARERMYRDAVERFIGYCFNYISGDYDPTASIGMRYLDMVPLVKNTCFGKYVDQARGRFHEFGESWKSIMRDLAESGDADAMCVSAAFAGEKQDIERLKRAADMGCGFAQLLYGIKANDEQYMRLAAENGVAGAARELGFHLVHDPSTAAAGMEFVKKAADDGDPWAQVVYADWLMMQHGRQSEEAVGYFKRAADEGLCIARFKYGICLWKGDGVPQNLEEAARYIKLAASQDHDVILGLGQNPVLEYGIQWNAEEVARFLEFLIDADPESAWKLLTTTWDIPMPPDFREQIPHFLKLIADKGSPNLQWAYACDLFRGVKSERYIVPKNFEEAARYFNLAADKFSPRGKRDYAEKLLSGREVPKNPSEAARYFKLAADEGGSDIKWQCAERLQRMGVPNCEEAARYFKLAADEGNSYYKRMYAARLAEGDGVPRNLEEAAKYYKLAADEGDGGEKRIYAESLIRGDEAQQNCEEAARYFKLAADCCGGFFPSSEALRYAQRLACGDGVPMNREEAARYFKLAADRGQRNEKIQYAKRLAEGNDVPQDLQEAHRYSILAEIGSFRAFFSRW